MISRKDKQKVEYGVLTLTRGWYLFGFIPLYVQVSGSTSFQYHAFFEPKKYENKVSS